MILSMSFPRKGGFDIGLHVFITEALRLDLKSGLITALFRP